MKRFVSNIELNREILKFILPFLLVGVVGILIGIYKNNLASQSFKWPRVYGEVLKVDMKVKQTRGQSSPGEGHANSRTSYVPVIEYQFLVKGISYISKQISFGDNTYDTKAEAESILQGHKVGGKITVYYHPDNPKTSVIKLVEPDPFRPFLIVGIGFCSISLLFIGMGFLNKMKKKMEQV